MALEELMGQWAQRGIQDRVVNQDQLAHRAVKVCQAKRDDRAKAKEDRADPKDRKAKMDLKANEVNRVRLGMMGLKELVDDLGLLVLKGQLVQRARLVHWEK